MEITLNDTNPTLCLNMIVKNESKVILRLLESVLPIIDCYCICDTGSTDDTISIIENFFLNSIRNVSGKIVKEPFKNFEHNRNFALSSCVGMSDFVLLLDADMILKISDFNKKMLHNFDSMTILQGNDNFYYYNMRIIRNNGLYSYKGVTHEYINVPERNRNSSLKKDMLFILDLGDGGAKNDKNERDTRLLLKGIEEEPNNDRYHFYLANTYKDSGNFEKAIEYYEKRIKIGGWPQEVWYSYYNIGCCYKDMGKPNDAIVYWLNAYDYLPDRIESLYEIVTHYRVISKHKLALHFYNLAINMLSKNIDKDSFLFLKNDIYTHKIFYEYTIFASYVGVKNINAEVVKVLNNSDDNMCNTNLFSNMKFYKHILQPEKVLVFDSKTNINVNNDFIDFYSSSSCLIPNEANDGYLMNVRYVNYYVTEIGSYINCDKNIITANKFVEFSKDLNFIKEKWFDVSYDNRLYIGVEDIRIFKDVETNNVLFLGTGFHENYSLGIVKGHYDINKSSLISKEIKQTFTHQSNCEKNWVFVDYNNSTHVIYKWSPLQICKINDETNELNLVCNKEMPKIFTHVRGSSSGFKYTKKICEINNENITIDIEETEIWFVVHIVSYEKPRHYYHMLVVFDNNMNLLRYSAPFKFEDQPIEYCLSIVVEDDRVLLNYSVWDRTTKIAIYDKKYIDSITSFS